MGGSLHSSFYFLISVFFSAPASQVLLTITPIANKDKEILGRGERWLETKKGRYEYLYINIFLCHILNMGSYMFLLQSFMYLKQIGRSWDIAMCVP